jgi:hypothetical protein
MQAQELVMRSAVFALLLRPRGKPLVPEPGCINRPCLLMCACYLLGKSKGT